jgi:integrase
MARRGNGEGSIYQGTDGRWRGYVDLGYVRGKRSRKYVTGSTRKEVAAKLRRAVEARDAGTLQIGQKPMTLGEWLAFYLDTIASGRVRPSTLAGYRGYVTRRITPGLGDHRLDKLQPEHLEAFYRASREDGMAPASVLQMHRIISRALKIAHRRGHVARNVATLVDAPSVPHEEINPLSATEARAILEHCRDERNSARWSVALALGLRQGEALGLQWSDIDLNTGVLTVRHALQRLEEVGLVLVPPKSRAGIRSIVLPAPLITQLKEHRARQNRERLVAGSLWQDRQFVFATPIGTPVDPRNDYRAWRALLLGASVRPARLHDARHTAATLLLAQGIHPRVVMQILGHSQITLTLGTYSHVVPELAEEAAHAMTRALWDIDEKKDARATDNPVESEPVDDTENHLAAKLAAKPRELDQDTPVTPGLTRQNTVGRVGLEPTTYGLKVRSSAN